MKSTQFSIEDLKAKGYREESPGVFIPANTLKQGDVILMKIPAKPGKKVKLPKSKPIGLTAIENVLRAAGIKYVTEHRFSKVKKFRFDIAIPSLKLACEYEGVFSKKSRHTSLTGYTNDCSKYTLAAVEGWTVLRYTAKNYKSFIEDLKKILHARNLETNPRT